MHFLTISSIILCVAGSAWAAATPLSVEKYQGQTTGRYIVQLKQGASRDSVLSNVRVSQSAISHDLDIINGFTGTFGQGILDLLLAHPDVKSVSEDGIMSIVGTQTNAPWGLSRLSSSAILINQDDTQLAFTYNYPDDKDGAGVDVYVVDTGIFTNHTTFQGRARWGATFGGYADADGHGHGTHCAGTAIGYEYGVAKNASAIAVKVLNDAGSGAVSDIVNGLNWVLTQASSSGRPSVVSMSLSGGATTALDSAVQTLTSLGIHVAVAAGNSNTDAFLTSPARAPSAITVGASNIADARASFSNYGNVVDIFAPGQDVISSWITNATATNIISGTSMATPHVAGLIAYFIERDGNIPPATMSTKLTSSCLQGILTGIPAGTVNCLAHNL